MHVNKIVHLLKDYKILDNNADTRLICNDANNYIILSNVNFALVYKDATTNLNSYISDTVIVFDNVDTLIESMNLSSTTEFALACKNIWLLHIPGILSSLKSSTLLYYTYMNITEDDIDVGDEQLISKTLSHLVSAPTYYTRAIFDNASTSLQIVSDYLVLKSKYLMLSLGPEYVFYLSTYLKSCTNLTNCVHVVRSNTTAYIWIQRLLL